MTIDNRRLRRAKVAGGNGGTGAVTPVAGKRLLLALCAFGVLSCGGPALAEVQENEEAGSEAATTDTAANQDLLLFWEEKELYVQTATRTAKPISQVAENMEVVTAKDILEMNAHNLAEVLKRVPGLFVDMSTSDFGTPALLHIQGSNERHVTVLLDGVPWNFIGGGNADVGSIPLQIIDRIEIIKGAASSSWGSGLGGVINIITKGTGDSLRPKGMVSASYGEGNSGDYNAETYGKGGPVGYYLYAGRQASNGLRNDRDYQRNSFYGKLSASPAHNLDLTFSAGGSAPRYNEGYVRLGANIVNPIADTSTFFATGSFDYRITPELSLKGAGFTYDQKEDAPSYFIQSYAYRKHFIYDEQSVGGNLKLIYASGMHTVVLGTDLNYGNVDQLSSSTSRNPLTNIVTAPSNPNVDKFALFVNDTIVIDKLAITPGVRLDRSSLSNDFVSPSIGATYELGEHTIARASAARGFTAPSPSTLIGGGIGVNPNPLLTPEYGWSYQAGLESAVMDYVNLKGTVFRHDIKNEINLSTASMMYVNNGTVVRQGYELQAESAPVYNVSLKTAYSYVHTDADQEQPVNTVYSSVQVAVKYDDRQSIFAQLAGTYIKWDIPSTTPPARYDSMIFDLNLNKKFHVSEVTNVDAFVNVHNLFNGSQYTSGYFPNPGRWVEGGLRYNF